MALSRRSLIGEYIRRQRQQAKMSLRQLAAQAGVYNSYLSQVERGLRKPSAVILHQIARGMHISAQALSVQAGLLEDRSPHSDALAAIRADTNMTWRQRQVLIDIYESFRREKPDRDSGDRVDTSDESRSQTRLARNGDAVPDFREGASAYDARRSGQEDHQAQAVLRHRGRRRLRR
ncbi:helix-turn-helix domain-containing protein [Sphaerisporangium perillae]|uniref:helix-turn-helix domain-containing protein n=1 Tax=Sphaerisporangium perillae TaxID=2935860 RepID=UPI00200DD49B|nr:helix-turn-helix transcriptional regulator [Sphaerisporangium perillae]